MSSLTKKQLCKSTLSGFIAIILALPWIFLQEEIKQMASWGYTGLFLSCLLANATILIPAGSTLSVVIASTLLDPLLCILVGGIGATLGEQSAYLFGTLNSGQNKSPKSKFIEKWLTWMCRKSWLKVFIAAVVPLPIYDIIAVNAGSIHMSWGLYTLATICGKMVKYAVAVACFEFILPPIVKTMEDPFRTTIETILDTFMLINAE